MKLSINIRCIILLTESFIFEPVNLEKIIAYNKLISIIIENN